MIHVLLQRCARDSWSAPTGGLAVSVMRSTLHVPVR